MVFPPYYKEDNAHASSQGMDVKTSDVAVSSKEENNTAIIHETMTQGSVPYVNFTIDNSSTAPSNDGYESLTDTTMINTVDQSHNENLPNHIANGMHATIANDGMSAHQNPNAATDAPLLKHMTQETLRVPDFNHCDQDHSATMVSVAAKSIMHNGKEYTA